ncbi:hypothetical protein FNF29_00014 [Cafeteria roenbergensis]|uniref:HECT-type E3 ubiquitin transferase n=1 Tax=Cafeteria roenbergensis TaxID=33653 RepID=A0A5A8CXE9_CAFRO|nr:hypothetical protein FNF29_00014 [Cafeteria roenbergensis]|eukprot:KAA0157438.1 hypothetical protein FNF29_00014 [Cafeteria roenbergensis]
MESQIDRGFRLASSASTFESIGDMTAAYELWMQAANELLGVAEVLHDQDPRRSAHFAVSEADLAALLDADGDAAGDDDDDDDELALYGLPAPARDEAVGGPAAPAAPHLGLTPSDDAALQAELQAYLDAPLAGGGASPEPAGGSEARSEAAGASAAGGGDSHEDDEDEGTAQPAEDAPTPCGREGPGEEGGDGGAPGRDPGGEIGATPASREPAPAPSAPGPGPGSAPPGGGDAGPESLRVTVQQLEAELRELRQQRSASGEDSSAVAAAGMDGVEDMTVTFPASIPAAAAPADEATGLWALALARLHAVGLAGCLDAETVMVTPADTPAGLPTVTVLPVPAGTGALDSCAAPEAQQVASAGAPEAAAAAAAPAGMLPCIGGGFASRPADVFLVAGWLLEATSGRTPVVIPGEDTASVPAASPGLSPSDGRVLATLLRPCLSASPADRPSAADVCRHGWFLRSREDDLVASGAVASRESKRKMLRAYLAMLDASQEGVRARRITLRRSTMCQQLLEAVSRLSQTELRNRLTIVIENEPGVDAGGLLSEAYNATFSQLCKPDAPAKCGLSHPMFVCQEAAAEPLFLPYGEAEGTATAGMLSAPERRLYEGVGRLLARAVADRRPVPARFAPSLWKYLLGLPVVLADLRAFDPRQAASLERLLDMKPEAFEYLYLDFEGLAPRGGDTPVTAANVERFVELKARQQLLGSRVHRLKAIRAGFEAHPLSGPLLVLSHAELVGAVCGAQEVTGPQVAAKLRFSGFREGSSIPRHMTAAVKALSPELCSKLLLYVTGLSALPGPDKSIRIAAVARTGQLPEAHTCFLRLDVCDDNADADEVARRLRTAIEHLADAGFGIE